MPRVGRKTKFTPEVCETVLKAISLGAPIYLAAQSAGISQPTIHLWMRQAERAGRGPLYNFLCNIKKAQGQAVSKWLNDIEKAANNGNWTASAWKLERLYPDQFGRQEKRTTEEKPVDITFNIVADSDTKTLISTLTKRITSSREGFAGGNGLVYHSRKVGTLSTPSLPQPETH